MCQNLADTVICNASAHVAVAPKMVDSTKCKEFVINTQNEKILVEPGGNGYTYKCQRCGKQVIEFISEIRTVIWRKEE
jgi:hypothetical protein